MPRDYYVIDDNGRRITYEVGPVELLLDNELAESETRLADYATIAKLLR
jgi:hypothetical protein